MSEHTVKKCDVCQKEMGSNSDKSYSSYVSVRVDPEDGALRVSFSAYYTSNDGKWDRNEPKGGDTCSRACALVMLRNAVAYLEKRDEEAKKAAEAEAARKKANEDRRREEFLRGEPKKSC